MSAPPPGDRPPAVPWPANPEDSVGVSPRVDIVFRELFGTPGHEALLMELLNELLAWPAPITELSLLPDALLPEQLDEKSVIIDVQATDAEGRVFQIEMQAAPEPAFERRALVGLAGLVRRRVKRGDSYAELRPSIALWLCDRDVLPQVLGEDGQPVHHRSFVLMDAARPVRFTDLIELHVIELDRLRKKRRAAPPQPAERWQRFMAEGERWSPGALSGTLLTTPNLEAAMTVLQSYTDDDVKRRMYERRMEALRVERTRQHEAEQAERARLESEKARFEADKARFEADKARLEADKARLEAEQARMESEKARMESEKARIEAEEALEVERQSRLQAEHEIAALRALLEKLGGGQQP